MGGGRKGTAQAYMANSGLAVDHSIDQRRDACAGHTAHKKEDDQNHGTGIVPLSSPSGVH